MAGAAMSVLVPDSARPGPEVMPIVVAHAERGIALQQALRAVLVVFVAATVIWLPPAVGAGACGRCRCLRSSPPAMWSQPSA
jgi:hypothetical protein